MAAFFQFSATVFLALVFSSVPALAAEPGSRQPDSTPVTKLPAGESKVVVEIPRSQWCQCVRAILDVEGGDIAGCVKSGASEEKLKIFRQRGTGDGSSRSVSFLLSFAGCEESESENVGALSFNVEWQDTPARPSVPQADKPARQPEPSLTPVSCAAGGIARIDATLYRSYGQKLAAAGPWDCSTLPGTLNNIPVSAGIRLVITGKSSSGSVLFRGERTNLTITHRQRTDLGTIAAPSFVPALSEPTNAAMLGSGRVAFAWTRPSGATAYRIQVANNPDFSPAVLDAAAQTLSYKADTALASGAYFWRVKAQDDFDNSGEWSSPGSITVDADPPINTTARTFINRGAPATNARTVSLAISAVKKGGSAINGYYISEMPKKPAAGAKGWTALSSTLSYTADVPFTLSKKDGKKTVSVWFKDALGHLSEAKSGSIIVDTNLPRATITGHPADPTNATTAKFSFTSTKAGSKFECQLDDGVYSACTVSRSYEALPAGAHTFRVKVSDALGNTDLSPTSFTWTIDLTPPRTEMTSQPSKETDTNTASFGFTSTEPGSLFQCRLDDKEYSACSSPKAYAGLAKGPHAFTIKATDAAGNVDPAPPQYTWSILDTFRTTITEHPADPVRSTRAMFRFIANRDGSTFQCRLDNGEYAACASPMTYTALTEGTHTFSVQASHAMAEGASSTAQYTWTVHQPPSYTTPISAMFDGQAITDSPAFAVLGATPLSFTRPASPRALAFSALTGFDQNGTAELGIAADLSPYLLLQEKSLTLEQFHNSARAQDLSRIELSFAATQGRTHYDEATRLAASVRWIVWDDGDIRTDKDLIACINNDQQYAPVEGFPGEDAQAARTRVCRQESIARRWNRSAADIGVAFAWIDKGGPADSFSSNGYSTWASASYGFDHFAPLKDNSQITVLARYRKHEVAPYPDLSGQFLVRDRYSLGVQYRFGDPNGTLFLQGMFRQTKNQGQSAEGSFPLSAGAEFRIDGNLWLQLEAGSLTSPSPSEAPSFVVIQIKWAP